MSVPLFHLLLSQSSPLQFASGIFEFLYKAINFQLFLKWPCTSQNYDLSASNSIGINIIESFIFVLQFLFFFFLNLHLKIFCKLSYLTLSVFWKQSYLKNIWKLPSKISMAERFLRTLAGSLWAFQVKTCRLYRVCSLKRDSTAEFRILIQDFQDFMKFQNFKTMKGQRSQFEGLHIA